MIVAVVGAAKQQPVVLVVEDEVLVRSAVAEELREAGFQVIEACDADEALRALSAIQIDIVLTDVTMPGSLDGIGLAKWVRQHKPAAKILLTSGKGYLPSETEGLGEFIAKPYRYSEVISKIRAAVNSK